MNIQGIYQHEWYNYRPGTVTGTINSNRITLVVPEMSYGTRVTNCINIEAIITGDEGRGTNHIRRVAPSNDTWNCNLQLSIFNLQQNHNDRSTK